MELQNQLRPGFVNALVEPGPGKSAVQACTESQPPLRHRTMLCPLQKCYVLMWLVGIHLVFDRPVVPGEH